MELNATHTRTASNIFRLNERNKETPTHASVLKDRALKEMEELGKKQGPDVLLSRILPVDVCRHAGRSRTRGIVWDSAASGESK